MSYSAYVRDFLVDAPAEIIGKLTLQNSDKGFHSHFHSQTDAWRDQLALLQSALRDLSNAYIVLEYTIPRRGKRIDAVLLVQNIILVLEFKMQQGDTYDRASIEQVEDYCLDLRDFHALSRGHAIVPILVVSCAKSSIAPMRSTTEPVKPAWKTNAGDLRNTLAEVLKQYFSPMLKPIDPKEWVQSSYLPSPTIVEAAQYLYAGMSVEEIARHHAGENLNHTTQAVLEAIIRARANQRKVICFVTGVPGAGKTLAGLNIAHSPDVRERELGIFLSGNGPLVKVLREALARDQVRREKIRLADSRRMVSTFIQNVHHFIDEYYSKPNEVPQDRVAIFDEAQRAWNRRQSLRKFKRDISEPELMMQIMDRHSDWCAIVALIGNGQEINSGEAGLAEWGRAIASRFSHWEVVLSPRLLSVSQNKFDSIFNDGAGKVAVREDKRLDLLVSLRSIHADSLNEFVSAILVKDVERGREQLQKLGSFQCVATRSMGTLRRWLKERRRGSRRCGLIASSSARRLRRYGLDVTVQLDVENWFLNPSDDVRSSSFLEVPATEFGIQGLELDWTGLCWGNDLIPIKNGWRYRAFKGTKWQSIHDPVRREYLLNKYRVLLTRARSGMIIWIPKGRRNDSTLDRREFDRVAQYFESFGMRFID